MPVRYAGRGIARGLRHAGGPAALTSPTLRRELAIKVGFTYGPVVPKGGDVFGDTVNVCARLVGIANPRQVLTTQQTVDALSPGLRKRCRTLPPTRVRGRAAEVVACEVLWRGDADITALNLTKETLAKAAHWVLSLSYGDETFTVVHSASVRIGRDKENDVVVASQHASRLHARVFAREGNFVIADQSSNGTFLLVDGSTREIRCAARRRCSASAAGSAWATRPRARATTCCATGCSAAAASAS